MAKKKKPALKRVIRKQVKKIKQIKLKKLETKVTKLFDEAKIKYKTFAASVVYTAHDVGKPRLKKLGEIAKVVLVRRIRTLC